MSKEIFRCVYGSKLFGTSTPDSDDDFRSVIIPSDTDILLGRASKIRQTESRDRANIAGDVDKTEIPVQAFLSLLMESELTAIETLFAPPLEKTEEWDVIYDNRHHLISSNVSKFTGFSKSQIMRYGGRGEDFSAAKELISMLGEYRGNEPISRNPELMERINEMTSRHKKLIVSFDPVHTHVPTITLNGRTAQLTQKRTSVMDIFQRVIDRSGERTRKAAENPDKADYKGLYHAVRILYQAEELLNTGEIRFPLESAPVLLDIRAGKHSQETCIDMADEVLARVDEAKGKTSLPEFVNTDVATEIILSTHRDTVINMLDEQEYQYSM